MRFVVVEIPDNAEAEAFISAIKNQAVFYGVRNGTTEVDGREVDEIKWVDIPDTWKVPQVYAAPTLFCECATTYKEGRSQKFGWWVCSNCSKPRKGSMQHPFNLVERNVPAMERVYYMGFRADRRGWRIPKVNP